MAAISARRLTVFYISFYYPISLWCPVHFSSLLHPAIFFSFSPVPLPLVLEAGPCKWLFLFPFPFKILSTSYTFLLVHACAVVLLCFKMHVQDQGPKQRVMG